MNVRISGRHAVMLVAALLVAAGLPTLAAPAMALSPACRGGHDASRPGGGGARATGPRCGAGEAGRPNPAAAPPAVIRNRAAVLPALRAGHHVTAALPRSLATVPEPGFASLLDGVFCVTPANCWAVGTYSPSSQEELVLNEVLHWNGTAWSQVTVPNPGGTVNGGVSQLFGVRCVTAGNCWAVGNYGSGTNGPGLNQALHWNGTRWSVAAVPNPGGTASGDLNQLFDVVCPSATNCWAVGQYGPGHGFSQTLNQALHWNGARWSLVPTPNPGGTSANEVNSLDAVRCPAAGTCLAAGSYGTFIGPAISLNQALLWNGTTWTQVATPNPGGTTADGDTNVLLGLGCSSPRNCWAVGTYGSPAGSFNEAMHWDGAALSLVTTPNPGGLGEAINLLNAVTCRAAIDCWAVGTAGPNNTAEANQALHWDGGLWSVVPTPNPAGTTNAENSLQSIRCTSASNCWAVGSVRNNTTILGEALHWDGSAWSAG